MPMIYVMLHEGKSAEYKQQVSDGIHAAMVNVLHVPPDTYDHFFSEKAKGDMVYDRKYFGVERTDDMMFIQFFFNTRPAALKQKLFERVADEITQRTGLRREDLLMSIVEVAADNWWAFGRTTDPKTGFDTRMKDGGDA